MVKWKCTQRTEKERFAIVRELKAHPEWSYNKASKILGVKKSTLINYEKQYWEKVDTEDGCDQLCKRGGGRKHHQKPYEARVLENYDTCLREGDGFKTDITNRGFQIDVLASYLTSVDLPKYARISRRGPL
ncbi:hypothetical protein DVH05_013438 [Phytophthora capsici]|nr:hypothetical protein DVH05_013438 [Phytophthora capsici]